MLPNPTEHPLDAKCANCGETWGRHSGYACPTGGTRFAAKPCCGVPVKCLEPDAECVTREMHASERGLYHPLDSAADMKHYDAITAAYRESPPPFQGPVGSTGGAKLKGNHYYRVTVGDPMSDELGPYTAECADIIEALGMTFNEGEAFKAIWRLAAGRTLGLKKNDPQYDADKAAHYGGRVAVQVARNAKS